MTVTDIQGDEPISPRRATSDSARIAREAVALVQPFHQPIGVWNAEAVRLAARAHRARLHGRYDDAVAEAMETLLRYIEVQAARFEAVIAAAPEDVRFHSRIGDTRQAFAMVARRLEAELRS